MCTHWKSPFSSRNSRKAHNAIATICLQDQSPISCQRHRKATSAKNYNKHFTTYTRPTSRKKSLLVTAIVTQEPLQKPTSAAKSLPTKCTPSSSTGGIPELFKRVTRHAVAFPTRSASHSCALHGCSDPGSALISGAVVLPADPGVSDITAGPSLCPVVRDAP